VSEQGKEAVVALLGADNFFGEGCLAGEALRLSTVSALTKCSIVRISKADITRVIHEEPAFAELFISHLLARNSRIEEDLVDQLFNSSEKRLARTLLLLANFGKEGRPEPIIAKVSQETLAEMIGTTRSRVSFFMNKFWKLGLIDYNGSIEIHSSLLNVVLRDQPQIRRWDSIYLNLTLRRFNATAFDALDRARIDATILGLDISEHHLGHITRRPADQWSAADCEWMGSVVSALRAWTGARPGLSTAKPSNGVAVGIQHVSIMFCCEFSRLGAIQLTLNRKHCRF
jgi:CRP/FNR family transcriptional regulator, cyclic AMP receptor protein